MMPLYRTIIKFFSVIMIFVLGSGLGIEFSAHSEGVSSPTTLDGGSGQSPTALGAGSGVSPTAGPAPVMDIATPSGSGLSHNIHQRFDVDGGGLVLNNIDQASGVSQLAGTIIGNKNLQRSGPATIILNEVIAPNPSQILGFVEIAGRSADLIIANPWGIACAGCGFLNSSHVSLTTGTPIIESGALRGFIVRDGEISFDNGSGQNSTAGNPANFSNIDLFDIMARRVVLKGPVYGKSLRLSLGRNEIDYQTGALKPLSDSGSSAKKPEFSLDSSALGGMYAQAISIRSTEAGVGVRMAGTMAAHSGELTLTSEGKIIVGAVRAKKSVHLQAKRKIIAQKITSPGAVRLKSPDTIILPDVEAGSLQVQSQLLNLTNATLVANAIDLQASQNIMAHGALIRTIHNSERLAPDDARPLGSLSERLALGSPQPLGAGLILTTPSLLVDRQSLIVSAQDLHLYTDVFDNQAQAIAALDGHLFIKAHYLDNHSILYGGNSVHLDIADNLINQRDGLILALQNNVRIGTFSLHNYGQMQAGNLLAISADSVLNKREVFSSISTQRSATIDLGSFVLRPDLRAFVEGPEFNHRTVALERDRGWVYDFQWQKFMQGAYGTINVGGVTLATAPWDRIGSWRRMGVVRAVIDQAMRDYPNKMVLYHHDPIGKDYGELHVYDQNAGLSSYSETQSADVRFGGAASLYGGRTLLINARSVVNDYGLIASGGNAVITAANIINEGQSLTRRTYATCRSSADCYQIDRHGNRINGTTLTNGQTGLVSEQIIGTLGGSISAAHNLRINGALHNRAGNKIAAHLGSIASPMTLPLPDLTSGAGVDFDEDWELSSAPELGYNIFVTPPLAERLVPDEAQPLGSLSERLAPDEARPLGVVNADLVMPSPAIELPPVERPRPRLSSLLNLSGAGYFMKALALAPDPKVLYLKDAMVELRLINQIVSQRLGRPIINVGYGNAIAQMKRLIDRGVAFAKELHLTPGVALSVAQQKALTAPLVWYQDRVLKDGRIARLPTVYFPAMSAERLGGPQSETLNINGSGAIIAAKNIIINSPAHVMNQGATIAASQNLTINSVGDFIHNRAMISAGDNLTLLADQIKINPDSRVKSAGNLSLASQQDLTLSAQRLEAGKDLSLSSARSISLLSEQVTRESHLSEKHGKTKLTISESSTTPIVTQLVAGEKLILNAGNSLISQGASLEAGRDIALTAKGAIVLGSAMAHQKLITQTNQKGFLSKKSSVDVYEGSHAIGTKLSAEQGAVTLNAGDRIIAQGSQMSGATVDLRAGSIDLLADYNSENFSSQGKSSGLKIGGGFLGYQKLKQQISSQTITPIATTLTAQNDVIVSASAGDVTLQGAQLRGGRDVTIKAAHDVNLLSAQQLVRSAQSSQKNSFGLSLKASENITGAARALDHAGSRLGAINQTMGTVSAVSSTLNAYDRVLEAWRNPVSASVSLGISRETSQSAEQRVVPMVSTLTSGRNIAIDAGNDINAQGAQIVAGEDLSLSAARDLKLHPDFSSTQMSASSKQSSASLGVTAGLSLSGLSVGPSASLSASRSDHQSTDHIPMMGRIVGETIKLSSGRDTEIIGTVVEGDRIAAKVGGDLTISSTPRTASASGSSDQLGLSFGPLPSSISIGKGKSESKVQWIDEQAGLFGRSVDLTVKNNTALNGAIIAGSEVTIDTGTLSSQDLNGFEKSKSVQGTITLSPESASSVGGSYQSGDKEQIARATIAGDDKTIIVRKPEQQSQNIALINPDLSRALETTKDKSIDAEFYLSDQSLKAAFEAGATVSQVASRLLTQTGEHDLAQALSSGKISTQEALRQLSACQGQQGFNYNPLNILIGTAYAASGCVLNTIDGRAIVVSNKENCSWALMRSVWNQMEAVGSGDFYAGVGQGLKEQGAEFVELVSDPKGTAKAILALGYEAIKDPKGVAAQILGSSQGQFYEYLGALSSGDYRKAGSLASGLAIDIAAKFTGAGAALYSGYKLSGPLAKVAERMVEKAKFNKTPSTITRAETGTLTGLKKQIGVYEKTSLRTEFFDELGTPVKWRNPASGKIEALPSSEALLKSGEKITQDHIFPVLQIKRLKDFRTLTPEQQKLLLNDKINIQPMLGRMNSSKHSRVEGTERSWDSYKGEPINPEYKGWLKQQQDDMTEYFNKRIEEMKQENIIQK